MIVKLASAAVLAIASATFSAPSFAAPLNVDVRIAPPAPRHEAMPGPRAGYVWTPGYWDWRGNRHVRVSGNWVRERRGYVYTQPTWVNDNGRWHFYCGEWARGDRDGDGIPNRYDRNPNRANRGDRDRDGVPNRFDRDRDNDGIRNRSDRDRDGDGVPNRRDSRPDNPNRR